MFNKTQIRSAAVAVALSIAASPSFAAIVNYNFDGDSGQSFGATTSTSSITIGNATFSQANASAATYAFNFGPNNGTFTNIGGGAGTILTTNGFASASPGGAPASLTISFASTVYAINFNYGTGDFVYTPDGGDALTATINNTPVATSVPTYSATNGDFFAEGSFSYASATGFTSITLTSTDAAGAEDLALGDLTTSTTPVPLPAGVWLLGSGFALLGFKSRRRAA
jgi:hypothetical protein